MNEIEKLYELTGFKRSKPSCAECFLDRHSCCRSYDECPELYPLFTAEKQIQLIEFMLKKYGEETIGFELWKDKSYHVMCHLGYDGFDNYADSNTLSGALAGLITLYWQDLTETEQEGIRKILKG